MHFLFPDSISSSSPSESCSGGQAAVTGDEHDKHRRMTEQGTSTPQVANGPSDTKGKQRLKSSLRASSTPRYSAISTVLATPVQSDNSSSDSGVTKGKRKADEVDAISPDQKSLHATFAVPEDLPRESQFSFSSRHAHSVACSGETHRCRSTRTLVFPCQTRQTFHFVFTWPFLFPS